MSFIGWIDLRYDRELISLLRRKAIMAEPELKLQNQPKGFSMWFKIDTGRLSASLHIRDHSVKKRASMFRTAAKWIRKNLPMAVILDAGWSDTAGGAMYKFERGKWLMYKCGDWANPWQNSIDGLVPGKWLHDKLSVKFLKDSGYAYGKLSESDYTSENFLIHVGGEYIHERFLKKSNTRRDLSSVHSNWEHTPKEVITMDEFGKVTKITVIEKSTDSKSNNLSILQKIKKLF